VSRVASRAGKNNNLTASGKNNNQPLLTAGRGHNEKKHNKATEQS